MGEDSPHRWRRQIGGFHLVLVMCGLITLGATNFVLLKITYTAYGDRRSFFVNQAINFLYIIYGGLILYPRMWFTDNITHDMVSFPKRPFFVMGVLDSLGTFFTCLGTAYTPGSLSPLLNQLLIPFTMMISAQYIGARYGVREMLGAALIVAGACLSVVPSLITAEDDPSNDDIRWYAVVFYALSNAPMAMSACFKEATFESRTLDVWYLTQWVSIFQFLVSFLYMPLMSLPGFGSKTGMPFSEVPMAFSDGWQCFVHRVPECADHGAFWLLICYCGVNVLFSNLGLYLTKHGSAVLNSLSFSLLLPCSTCTFFMPLLGPFQEPLTKNAIFTFCGLPLALIGFWTYQHFAKSHAAAKDVPSPEVESCFLCTEPLESPRGQPSFQERVIGLGHPFGDYGRHGDFQRLPSG